MVPKPHVKYDKAVEELKANAETETNIFNADGEVRRESDNFAKVQEEQQKIHGYDERKPAPKDFTLV